MTSNSTGFVNWGSSRRFSFRRLLGLMFIALVPLLGGCGGDAYRYRLTVEVDDDGVIKSGWSVLEATPSYPYSLGDAGRIITIGVRGEAVYVDLGKGRHVIALLASGPFAEKDLPMKFLAATAFKQPGNTLDSWKIAGRETRIAEVESGRYPTFVTLTDLNNPMSAVVIDPNSMEKRVGGNSVSVKRITVQMTRDPISHKIEMLIPSLPKNRKAMSRLLTSPSRFAHHYDYYVRTHP